MYAISIEPSQATEILTGFRPSPCRFWQTDHRGLLLIHACKRRPLRAPQRLSRAQRATPSWAWWNW